MPCNIKKKSIYYSFISYSMIWYLSKGGEYKNVLGRVGGARKFICASTKVYRPGEQIFDKKRVLCTACIDDGEIIKF